MKKILGLTVAALMVMGLVGGGTWAYFSDPEATGNNVFSAGTLDLDLNSGDDTEPVMFTLLDQVPGAADNATLSLDYAGNLDGKLDISFSAINNVGLADGGTDEYGDDSGDLGGALEIAPYIDVDQTGDFTALTDWALKSNGGVDQTALQWDSLDSFASKSWTSVYGGVVTHNDSDNFTIEWRIPTTVGNSIQGDSANFTVTFTLQQAEKP